MTHINSYGTLTYTRITSARRPDLIIINIKKKKKKICKIVNFAVPADHRIKLKECEKKDKYHNFARELKKLWNIKVTIIPIAICAFGTITKGLLKGLEDLKVGWREETIRMTALPEKGQNTEKSPGDIRRFADTQTPVKKTSANTDVKNSKRINNKNHNNITWLVHIICKILKSFIISLPRWNCVWNFLINHYYSLGLVSFPLDYSSSSPLKNTDRK